MQHDEDSPPPAYSMMVDEGVWEGAGKGYHRSRRNKNRELKDNPTQPNDQAQKKNKWNIWLVTYRSDPPKKNQNSEEGKGKKTRKRKKHDELDFVVRGIDDG